VKKIHLILVLIAFLAGCKNVAAPIIDDPVIINDPPTNSPPYAVSGPTGLINCSNGGTITLEFSDADGNPVLTPGVFDPEGDAVTYDVTVKDLSAGGIEPTTLIEGGVLTLDWIGNNIGKTAKFVITSSDATHITEPVAPLEEIIVLFL